LEEDEEDGLKVLEGGSKFRVESMDGRVYGEGPIS
jgi:hypothetical protein